MSNLTYYLTTEHGIEGADADASDHAATQLEALRDQAVFDGEWDPDVEHLEHGVLVPLGQARIVDSGACAEAPFLDQVDYAIQEPYDFDAAEFWRVLNEQAPKLAAKLADAAPVSSPWVPIDEYGELEEGRTYLVLVDGESLYLANWQMGEWLTIERIHPSRITHVHRMGPIRGPEEG